MGQRQPRQISSNSSFDPTQWVRITENSSLDQPAPAEFGRPETLKHRATSQLVDKYEDCFVTQKDYEDYLRSYEWRKEENCIVRAYHIVTKNKNRYCSTTYNVDTYIEHPKNRLSDFSDVPFPDTMYVLKAMLTGYSKLYNNIGAFPVKEEQVCIDEMGNVKVWLNQNLSKNFPEDWTLEPRVRTAQQEEEEMVTEIVKLMDRNSDHETEPVPRFLDTFEKKKETIKMGFQEASQLVKDYVAMNNETMPSYFVSVMQVYEGQDDLYDNEGIENEETNPSNHDRIRISYGNQDQQQGFGEITQREINHSRNSQSYRESQVGRVTNRSLKSRDSRGSQIDNLQRKVPIQQNLNMNQAIAREMRLSSLSNKNKEETYRLSSLSRLDDNDNAKAQRQSQLQQFKITSSNNQMMKKLSSEDNLRHSERSNAHNISQISNDPNNWIAQKPEQPYIPSSPAYQNLQLPVQNSQNQKSITGSQYSQRSQSEQNNNIFQQFEPRNAQTLRTDNSNSQTSQLQHRNLFQGIVSDAPAVQYLPPPSVIINSGRSSNYHQALPPPAQYFPFAQMTPTSNGNRMATTTKMSNYSISQKQEEYNLSNERFHESSKKENQNQTKGSKMAQHSIQNRSQQKGKQLSKVDNGMLFSLGGRNYQHEQDYEREEEQQYDNDLNYRRQNKLQQSKGSKPGEESGNFDALELSKEGLGQYHQKQESQNESKNDLPSSNADLRNPSSPNLPQNLPVTAQFIGPSQQSRESLNKNSQRLPSSSQFGSISDQPSSKNGQQQILNKTNSNPNGFTIFIKSPSHQNLVYSVPAQLRPQTGNPGIPVSPQQIALIRNNSQPYLPGNFVSPPKMGSQFSPRAQVVQPLSHRPQFPLAQFQAQTGSVASPRLVLNEPARFAQPTKTAVPFSSPNENQFIGKQNVQHKQVQQNYFSSSHNNQIQGEDKAPKNEEAITAYCTVESDNVELDPEIARDMLLLI